MVSGNGFVQEQILIRIQIVLSNLRNRNVKSAWSCTIQRTLHVFRAGSGFPERLGALHHKRRFWHQIEEFGQLGFHGFMDLVEIFNDLIGISKGHQFLALADMVEETFEIPLEAHLCFYFFHFQ